MEFTGDTEKPLLFLLTQLAESEILHFDRCFSVPSVYVPISDSIENGPSGGAAFSITKKFLKKTPFWSPVSPSRKSIRESLKSRCCLGFTFFKPDGPGIKK